MRRRILLLSVALVVAAGGACAVYWWLGAPAEAGEEPPADRPIYEVGSITTDLAVDAEGRRSWVQVSLQLECRDRDTLRAVEDNWVQIRNELLAIFRSSEAQSLKGEEGMHRLRRTIMERTNAILDGGELTDVYLISMVVH